MSSNEKLRLVAIGAAPTSLGFAYRINELIQEDNEIAKRVELTILEQVRLLGNFKNFLTTLITTHLIPFFRSQHPAACHVLLRTTRVFCGTWVDTLRLVTTFHITKKQPVGPSTNGTNSNVTAWST